MDFWCKTCCRKGSKQHRIVLLLCAALGYTGEVNQDTRECR